MQVNSGLVFELITQMQTRRMLPGWKREVEGTQVINNDFVTTITYHDGSTAFSANTASHILSGLQDDPDAGSIGAITVGGNTALTPTCKQWPGSSFSGDITAEEPLLRQLSRPVLVNRYYLGTFLPPLLEPVRLGKCKQRHPQSGRFWQHIFYRISYWFWGAELNTTDVIELGLRILHHPNHLMAMSVWLEPVIEKSKLQVARTPRIINSNKCIGCHFRF